MQIVFVQVEESLFIPQQRVTKIMTMIKTSGGISLFTAPDNGENASYMDVICNLPAIKMSAYNVQEQPAVFSFVKRNGHDTFPVEAFVTLNVYSRSSNILLELQPVGLMNTYSYTIPVDSLGLADYLQVIIYSEEQRNNELARSQKLNIIRENPIPFPRSEEWDPFLIYRNGEMTMLGEVVYMWNNPVSGNSLENPKDDIINNPITTSWVSYQNWPLLSTSILLAKFALVGKAVFYDEFMFSQHGVDDNGNESGNFHEFPSGKFKPNILLNFLTGKSEQRDGVFYGSIATPPKKIPHGVSVIDFSQGFNWWGSGGIGKEITAYLPTDKKYLGYNCYIFAPIGTRSSTGVQVRVQGNKAFANRALIDPVYEVNVEFGKLVTFYAIPTLEEDSVSWYFRE